ncbi:hypothetical protein ACFXAZ_02925 [Streptomyces sp. NPDC059477]|uniref:hypothetical protein n=1 Tax=Streptomyces sp. NPDC059477 TaxID=3346847 RepID=UPI0036C4E3E0
MTGSRTYQIYFTEQAAVARDRLDERQRNAFDKGMSLLARDPFPALSRPISATGDDRTILLTQNILVEYSVSMGRLLIFIVEVFNNKDVFVTEE